MKAIRYSVVTTLLTAALTIGPTSLWAHGPEGSNGHGKRSDRWGDERVRRPDSVKGILMDLDRQISYLEEDLERHNLSRVHAYSEKMDHLAGKLFEAPVAGGPPRKRRVESSLRTFRGLIQRIHRDGDAGRLLTTAAHVRKLRAQFSFLSKQLGYRII